MNWEINIDNSMVKESCNGLPYGTILCIILANSIYLNTCSLALIYDVHTFTA